MILFGSIFFFPNLTYFTEQEKKMRLSDRTALFSFPSKSFNLEYTTQTFFFLKKILCLNEKFLPLLLLLLKREQMCDNCGLVKSNTVIERESEHGLTINFKLDYFCS